VLLGALAGALIPGAEALEHSHHRHLPYPDPRVLHPGSPDESKHRAIITYWQENRRTKSAIARRTGFSSGTHLLSEYHQIEAHPDIAVGSSTLDDLVASVVQWARRHN
jgi:hypothetical protein